METQHYSKIARKWILDKRASEGPYWHGVYYGDPAQMEELCQLFGWTKEMDEKYGRIGMGYKHKKRYQFVLNKLDYESKKPDALFIKKFITYSGIINTPTRCFILKELVEEE